MKATMLTENDCCEGMVIEASPVETLVINKALRLMSENEEIAESDRRLAIQMGEDMKSFEQVEQTEPQTNWKRAECYEGCEWAKGSPQCDGCDRLTEPQTEGEE